MPPGGIAQRRTALPPRWLGHIPVQNCANDIFNVSWDLTCRPVRRIIVLLHWSARQRI